MPHVDGRIDHQAQAALATMATSPAKNSLPGSTVPRACPVAHSAIWAAMTLYG